MPLVYRQMLFCSVACGIRAEAATLCMPLSCYRLVVAASTDEILIIWACGFGLELASDLSI